MRARSMGVVLLLSLAGCSASLTGVFPIDGTWAEVQSVPGNSLTMTLTSSGSSVTGSGAFAGEAGPVGTVAVTGTTHASDVHLDLVLTSTVPVAGYIRHERQ